MEPETRGRVNERGIQNFDGQSIRSPKTSEQDSRIRNPTAGFSEGMMRRGGQQREISKVESEEVPRQQVKAQNEASEFGISSSTQLTEVPPSVVLSNKEEKTVVSSSLNDLQDQVKVRDLERDNDRGKSLISNEVARIISEFRTKKGIQDSSMELSSNLGRHDENRNPQGFENFGREKANPSKNQNQENLGFGAFYQQSMKRDSGFGQRGDSLSYGGRTTNVYHQSELSQSNVYGNLDFGRATDKSQNFAYNMPKEKPLYEGAGAGGNFGLRENQNRLNTQNSAAGYYDRSNPYSQSQMYSREFERQSLNPGYDNRYDNRNLREQQQQPPKSSLYQHQQQGKLFNCP